MLVPTIDKPKPPMTTPKKTMSFVPMSYSSLMTSYAPYQNAMQ
jgi:hypothetical protein